MLTVKQYKKWLKNYASAKSTQARSTVAVTVEKCGDHTLARINFVDRIGRSHHLSTYGDTKREALSDLVNQLTRFSTGNPTMNGTY